MKRVFISDCEGPISKNDNAFELTSAFVSNGAKLFSVISKYDDILADTLRRPNYNAGDTLKLILPFLKAFNMTDKKMRDFSASNLLFIADSKESLKNIRTKSSAFIISTSYEHYIRALCDSLDFPFHNTFCTRLTIDKYGISAEEKLRLREIAEEIGEMTMITIPGSARSISDFSINDQKTIGRLDEIFWDEIVSMKIGSVFSEVVPVGGRQKAEGIKRSVEKEGLNLEDVIYVGDSITDVEAFRLVRSNGGLALSFNGNPYAVRNADAVIMSESNLVTAVIVDLFRELTKQKTMEVLGNWDFESLKSSPAAKSAINFFGRHPANLTKVKIVTVQNEEVLARESNEFRKKVRGQAIGGLG